jgi:hypothetical protein
MCASTLFSCSCDGDVHVRLLELRRLAAGLAEAEHGPALALGTVHAARRDGRTGAGAVEQGLLCVPAARRTSHRASSTTLAIPVAVAVTISASISAFTTSRSAAPPGLACACGWW